MKKFFLLIAFATLTSTMMFAQTTPKAVGTSATKTEAPAKHAKKHETKSEKKATRKSTAKTSSKKAGITKKASKKSVKTTAQPAK